MTINQMVISPFDKLRVTIQDFCKSLRSEIFNYIKDGEELVQQPFYRLIEERRLITYPYDTMDFGVAWTPSKISKYLMIFTSGNRHLGKFEKLRRPKENKCVSIHR